MSYQPEKRTDHVERAPTRLIEQFRRKPILAALLRSYVARIQALEDAAWELILSRNIESGEGQTLDYIGRIIGRKRGGLNDDSYRIALRAQQAINRTQGRAEDIVKVFRLSLPPTKRQFRVTEYPIATFLIDVLASVTWDMGLAFANANQTRAAGVRLIVRYPVTDTDHTFELADTSPVRTMTNGLTSGGSSFGGRLSNVLTSELASNA